MKKLTLTLFSVIFLLSCSNAEKTKSSSIGESPEAIQEEPIKLEREDPVPNTISIKEVARIALIEAEQFIINAKINEVDYSSVTETLEKAKKAYDNNEFKQAQKLAVSVRQQIEALINN